MSLLRGRSQTSICGAAAAVPPPGLLWNSPSLLRSLHALSVTTDEGIQRCATTEIRSGNIPSLGVHRQARGVGVRAEVRARARARHAVDGVHCHAAGLGGATLRGPHAAGHVVQPVGRGLCQLRHAALVRCARHGGRHLGRHLAQLHGRGRRETGHADWALASTKGGVWAAHTARRCQAGSFKQLPGTPPHP